MVLAGTKVLFSLIAIETLMKIVSRLVEMKLKMYNFNIYFKKLIPVSVLKKRNSFTKVNKLQHFKTV